ncbi:MAG TPA: GNAT family N-acetyltransferase [Gammaproteobacteria bacterium]
MFVVSQNRRVRDIYNYRQTIFRFMHNLSGLTSEMLVRFTQIDYDREMAFIAVVQNGDAETEVGVTRYTIETDAKTCEFAIVVADEWHQHGIAHKLMEQLMEYARYHGLEAMRGHVLVTGK